LEKGSLRSMLPKDIKAGRIPKPLGIIESEIETGIAARYVLKRISKENIKDMGRQLSKTSHNNPLVVFTDILAKIESYDNLISHDGRYLPICNGTKLGRDGVLLTFNPYF